ncbi:amidase [Hahella sp. CCB-MM4]|uniref:amidase n=1 Tax=Hahella sp. (strain CCB-MM4) TaxID=1926491 RepID=UPI000B9AFEA9|nr:amidase [Hahella sp. CCB-MM4]OZG71607.1 amidase [Hahella sp. CCB-MM4]
MPYDLKSLKVPRLAGAPLKSIVALMENNYSRTLLSPALMKETGASKIRSTRLNTLPTFLPKHAYGRQLSAERAKSTLEIFAEPDFQASESPLPSVMDYARAYRSGQIGPEEIADKVIAAITESDRKQPPLRAIITTFDQDIRHQASESAKRLANGQPLSLLDGVPVAIKDEIDAVPYATTVGTRVYGNDNSAEHDATVVARLRAAGAVIIGKANMQEIGIGVTGANSHHGHCRNPHNLHHYPGGSSSGSAASVAAGLCPVAIGADGGGSIRIPASLCGLAGLKPTWGRVSEHGAFPLCWSVAHIGPIGQTVDDVAMAYALIAGADPLDPYCVEQPLPHLSDYRNKDLSGLTIGVFSSWFSHASREVVQKCQLAVEKLKSLGVTVKTINIEDLDLQRIAHALTISSEMLAAVDMEHRHNSKVFALDTRLNLALAKVFSSTDYVKAQRVRTLAINEFNRVLQDVDMIVTPTTAITAPPVQQESDDSAESNIQVLTELMRFAFPANLTGLPALTVPVDYDEKGLPIGLQLMGKAWSEHLLLRCGKALEGLCERKRAAYSFNMLR